MPSAENNISDPDFLSVTISLSRTSLAYLSSALRLYALVWLISFYKPGKFSACCPESNETLLFFDVVLAFILTEAIESRDD